MAASDTETRANGTLKAACSTGTNATVGSTHTLKRSRTPSGRNVNRSGRFTKPTTMASVDRIHSGIVMTLGDSCGWAWPRYSPKKVR
jgi:hypothetical protein